jgi:AcrR family transcriptional regulator
MVIGTRYATILDAAADVFARQGYHAASVRQIAHTARLSLAGLYHYVGGKQELLFLVLDRGLDTLLGMLTGALAEARTPEARLLALVRTHLDFGYTHPSVLRVLNRDWEMVAPAHRAEIAAKRRAYIDQGLRVLASLDPHGRPGDELYSATNLLLGMLNGIASGPFVRSHDDAGALAAEVGALFLYGFLERASAPEPVGAAGGPHDA